jgi:hypothetical protein
MEENTVTTMEAEQTSDAFLAGWDDTGIAFTADQPDEAIEEPVAESEADAEGVAENQGAPVEQTSSESQEEPMASESEVKVDAPKQWTLQHMDEVKTVGEDEIVTLAQKGMDYDRIRGKWNEAKPVMELFNQFAQKAGMSVSDYVTYIRTQAKQSQGMSEEDAKRSVELEDREAVVAAKEAQQNAERTAQTRRAEQEQRRQADIEAFRKIYPDAAKDPKGIPAEVWQRVNEGMNLVAAYAVYDAKQARAAQAAAEQKAAAAMQNHANAARTTGSMHSSGDNTKVSKDAFLDGWDS